MKEYLYLEHDGKLLLVDNEGNGPRKPQMGRVNWIGDSPLIRLPTTSEVNEMGITWDKKRINQIHLENIDARVIIGTPKINWPENWAWKDSVISDNAVDPVVRELVYRTIHRVVSKVIIENNEGMILMAKASRGFFTGCWTLPGGFVDYGEHPRQAAIREAKEELNIDIEIADPLGCTPDFFLFDKERKLFYRGQYDSSRPGNDTEVSGVDLADAIDALRTESSAPIDQAPSLGCNIKWKKGNEPDYLG